MNWFTSDTHAWHSNIIKYCDRPFANADEMTKTIAANINSRVAPNDTLYHLGDFAFGRPGQILAFRSMINCANIIFICGNHDKEIERDRTLQKTLFKEFHYLLDRNIEGIHFTLCHYAMRVWNKSHHGSFHLYGHSHGTLEATPWPNSFDVGVDCHNFFPLNVTEISQRMRRV